MAPNRIDTINAVGLCDRPAALAQIAAVLDGHGLGTTRWMVSALSRIKADLESFGELPWHRDAAIRRILSDMSDRRADAVGAAGSRPAPPARRHHVCHVVCRLLVDNAPGPARREFDRPGPRRHLASLVTLFQC